MLKLLFLLATCQAWQHFLSFNDKCSAELSFLRGSKLETTITAGRVPYQFKYALQEVLKARILAEGCNAGSNHDLFFGMNLRNVMRFLDASDTTLASASMPAACSSLSFSWKDLKEFFPGFVLPSSCKSANFQTTGKCQMKFKFLDNLFIELVLQENCNAEGEAGYGLPSFNLFCSGSLCDSFARPCSANSDCGTGVTCDALPGDVTLQGGIDALIDFGLFNNDTDASCSDATNSFQEKFWSGILNSGAYLAGLTPSVSSKTYKEVKLCGMSDFFDKFIPTRAPTPTQQYRCDNNSLIYVSQVCDGQTDCSNGEDEANCCGQNRQRPFSGSNDCCPICPNDQDGPSCSNYRCGFISSNGDDGFDITAVCPQSATSEGVLDCPDFMLFSDTPIPDSPAKQVLTSVFPSTAEQHIAGWADCNGNVQVGSAAEMAVVNARLPIHRVIAELEKVMKSMESCRAGTAPAPAAFARYFFPWATSLWGGVFFSDQSTQGIYNNVNPGAKLDETIRYYGAAEEYDIVNNSRVYRLNPPLANVANAPASCDFASTTGASPSCELSADISSWFDGPFFPAGWNGPTTLKVKFASTCSDSSAPTVFLTCEGKCDATAKSGCCILRNAIVPPTSGSCPTGYKLQLLETEITDFAFNSSATPKSNDTTLINFVSLVLGRQIQFGGASPFASVQASEALRSFCILDGESFGDNIELWGKTTVTEDCPVPANPPNGTKGCPQFITTGKLQGCTGSSCLGVPATAQCNPQCPQTPTQGVSPAFVVAPTLGLLVAFVALV